MPKIKSPGTRPARQIEKPLPRVPKPDYTQKRNIPQPLRDVVSSAVTAGNLVKGAAGVVGEGVRKIKRSVSR